MIKTFTFCYPSMIVHANGCKDIKKDMQSNDTTVKVVASTLSEAVAKELIGDLEEMGYGPSDFTVKPCAR